MLSKKSLATTLGKSIVLSISSTCDYCDTDLSSQSAYIPIKTRRGVKVYSCSSCGLTQSAYTLPYVSRPAGNMSSDADRSSLRYTKTLVADSYKNVIEEHVPQDIKTILDIGSNRGVFARYALSRFPESKIYCVEPDSTVIDYYEENRLTVFDGRYEECEINDVKFDFAYSVHTFEHLSSCRLGFSKVSKSLKVGGVFLLAVPNLILHKDAIEEFFIDPHTFHFTHNTLKNFARSVGLSVIYENDPSSPDVILLLKKESESSDGGEDCLFQASFDFDSYAELIRSNRKKISNDVKAINDASNTDGVLIWGAGRIFDALVSYGQLQAGPNIYVYDKFLSAVVSQLNGFELISPEKLRDLVSDKVTVYVASRDYREEIKSECRAMGLNRIICFGG